MAESLEVSKSGFSAHRHKGEAPRRQEGLEIVRVIRPVFVESRQTHGSPRITAALRARGVRRGKNRVARLMEAGAMAALPAKERRGGFHEPQGQRLR
jgi:putative transposase